MNQKSEIFLREGTTVTSVCQVALPAPYVVAEDVKALVEIDGRTAKLMVSGVCVATVDLPR